MRLEAETPFTNFLSWTQGTCSRLSRTYNMANDMPSNAVTLVNGRRSGPGVVVCTLEERTKFRFALEKYPHGPWSAIADCIGTRNVRQTMTHAQKCRERQERHARGLKPSGRKRRTPSDTTSEESTSPRAPTNCTSSDPEDSVSVYNEEDFAWVMEHLERLEDA